MTSRKNLLLAAFGLLLGASAAMAAPASDPFAATDNYRLGDPATFRLLSGMGVPPAAPDAQTGPAARKAKTALLFPGLSDSDLFDLTFGPCRIASPLAQLEQRIARLGADHPYTHQWLEAEQAVMSTCSQPQLNKRPLVEFLLPPPLVTKDKAIATLQAQDRAYQQAANLFYLGKLPEALAAFRAIAADRASIDRPQAAFMVVAIQAGSAPNSYGYYGDPKPMVPAAQTRQQIDAILADPSLKDVHAMAASLIGWMAYYTGDDEQARAAQVREAITALMTPTQRLEQDSEARARYDAAMDDIEYLHSRFDDPNWVLSGAVPTNYYASAALARLAKINPMAAWVAFPSDPARDGNWAMIADLRQPAIVTDFLAKMGGNSGAFGNAWVHINPHTGTAIRRSMVDMEIARLKVGEDGQAAAALSFDFPNLVRQLVMSGSKPDFAEAVRRLKDYPAPATRLYRDTAHLALVSLIAAGRLDEARQLRDALMLDDTVGRGYSPNVGA